ncbi:MAG: GntR family transcriptional regulator [Paracoccaceae bacterium]
MTDASRKIPTHEVTYARLRDMVLFGELEPGQPVTILGLIGDMSAGMTPVREAIRRLCSQGALNLQGNRRICVPKLSLEALDQLAFARLQLEPHLALISANRLNHKTLEAMQESDARLNLAIAQGDVRAYLALNYEFHFALYRAAGAPILLDIAQSLWLRFGPSLRVVCAQYGRGGLPDRHRDVLNAAEMGDGAALAQAVSADVAQGIDQVRLALRSQAV